MIYIVLIVVLIVLFLISPSMSSREFKHQKYAHRGLYKEDQSIKENSMRAFEEAAVRGYGIELDVQLNLEDEVVIYHDFNLSRLEKEDSNIIDLNLVDLEKYEISTLKNVLKMIDGRVELIIELKSDKNRTRLCQKVSEILLDYKGPYCVESFDPRIVAWFKKYQPQMMRGQLIMPIHNYDNVVMGLFVNSLLYNVFTRPHFLAMNVKSTHFNPLVKLNQLMGVKTCLWTVHEIKQTQFNWVDAYIFEYFDA